MVTILLAYYYTNPRLSTWKQFRSGHETSAFALGHLDSEVPGRNNNDGVTVTVTMITAIHHSLTYSTLRANVCISTASHSSWRFFSLFGRFLAYRECP